MKHQKIFNVMLGIAVLIAATYKINAQTNLALSSTVSTSYVSPWETLEAVNDNYQPSSSTDNSQGAYGNWNGAENYNTWNWVEYDLGSEYQIASLSVYWWDDGYGIDQPTNAYIEYYNGSSWVNAGNIGLALDQFNTINVDFVTSAVRINMISNMATGILEWRVWGMSSDPGDDTQAPTTPGTPTATNVTGTSCSLSWSASSDNIGVTGYQVLQDGSQITIVSDPSAIISGLSANTTYTFAVRAYDAAGNVSSTSGSVTVTTTDSSSDTDPYEWPSYSPNISYDFRDEYGTVPTPSQVLDDCSGVAGTQSSEWWTFRWGGNANPLVTSAAITPMLDRLNTDFAYFRDVMGWPPDLRALNGYKSAVYLYGSGLCTDNASNTDLGGWQSAIYYNGQNWPMILASYYPVYSFDPACTYADKESQQSAMVHEGIHCVLASLPGCKDAAWFHEGGNTWLQQQAYADQSGNYSSMGDLNGCTFLAPFMPIECYSGWLQDGSFGGPSAEGVNMFEDGQQICTWRTYLGGNQYGNGFPTFLGMTLGNGSIPWIWKNCPSRVLEGMATGLGKTQIRRLISEYRAKQALLDMGQWIDAFKALLDAHFGQSIGAEWQPSWLNPEVWIATPYAATTNNGSGLLTPEARTTPGWSGANQIPLHVTGNMVTVNFQPIGANMTCQLCYRATDGSAVYSSLVSNGDCSLRLDKEPANGVVIAVITNTNYIYYGESTRTAHYDYRLQLGTEVTGTADIHTRWYDWAGALKSASELEVPIIAGFDASKYCSNSCHTTGPKDMVTDIYMQQQKESMETFVYPNPLMESNVLYIEFLNTNNESKNIEIINIQGQVVFESDITGQLLEIPTCGILQKGLYIINVNTKDETKTFKLMVQ